MFVCIHCQGEIASEHAQYQRVEHWEDPYPYCPHCGKVGAYRVRTALGAIVYCHGSWAGGVYNSFPSDRWTPDELEAIAKDLREQQAAGTLHYPDGSGDGQAGRKQARGTQCSTSSLTAEN